jgi:hypothetical protein
MMGLAIGVAILLLPFVGVVLAQYEPGIEAAQILLAGFYFLSLHGSSANLLLTINKQVQYLLIIACATLACVGLVAVALWFDFGIRGVAVAAGLSYLGYSLGLIVFVNRRYLPFGARPYGAGLYKLLLPWLTGAGMVLLVSVVQTESVSGTSMIQAVAYAVLYLLVFYPLARRHLFGRTGHAVI